MQVLNAYFLDDVGPIKQQPVQTNYYTADIKKKTFNYRYIPLVLVHEATGRYCSNRHPTTW